MGTVQGTRGPACTGNVAPNSFPNRFPTVMSASSARIWGMFPAMLQDRSNGG